MFVRRKLRWRPNADDTRIAKYRLFLFVGGGFLVFDQLTKLGILTIRTTEGFIAEVFGFFNVVLVFNYGISFGLFQAGSDSARWLLISATSFVVILLLFMLLRARTTYRVVVLSMIIGGAIGNIIDRLYLGKVVDFLDFHVFGFHWPSFNVGDIGIVVGAILFAFENRFARYFTSQEEDFEDDIGYMDESDMDAFDDEDPDLLTEYFEAEDPPSKRGS